jgi:heme/copper-type cytochrome/quinol oxidase subunit 1
MVRRLLFAIVMLPAAAAMVAFAIANRQAITVSFDPFEPVDPAYAVTLPLYLLGFALLLVGVLLGGVAAWLRQAKWRRSGARLAAELRAIRAELDEITHMTRSARILPGPVSRRPLAA